MSFAGIHGQQRVAAFLLSLEPKVAAAILKSMSPDVVPRVAQAMVDLDPRLAQQGALDELVRELARHLAGPRTIRACEPERLNALLADAFGKQADELVRTIQERRAASRPFLELERHAPHELARLLRQESPAVAALVLVHLEPARTARVLKELEPDLAEDVVRRMVTLEPPVPALLRAVAADLTQRLAAAPLPAPASDPAQRVKSVAAILNHSAPEMEKRVLEALAESDAQRADELREQLFTWEDIGKLDRRAMTKILGTVDTKTLAVALKGCSPAVEQNVLSNLSSRVREMVQEERELAGAMALADVKSARDEILRSVRALIEAGEFRPNRRGDQLVE